MGLKIRKKASDIAPLEAGIYTGICVGVVDLGEQHNQKFGKWQDKVIFIFEIKDEFVDVDGEQKPRWLSKEFAASLNSKATLYKAIISWRGKPFTDEELIEFNPAELIRTGCQLQIITEEKDGRTYCNIENILALPKGVEVSDPISDIIIFDMDDKGGATEAFDKLPEWIQSRIESSPTWAELTSDKKEIDVEENEKAHAEIARVLTEEEPSF